MNVTMGGFSFGDAGTYKLDFKHVILLQNRSFLSNLHQLLVMLLVLVDATLLQVLLIQDSSDLLYQKPCFCFFTWKKCPPPVQPILLFLTTNNIALTVVIF